MSLYDDFQKKTGSFAPAAAPAPVAPPPPDVPWYRKAAQAVGLVQPVAPAPAPVAAPPAQTPSAPLPSVYDQFKAKSEAFSAPTAPAPVKQPMTQQQQFEATSVGGTPPAPPAKPLSIYEQFQASNSIKAAQAKKEADAKVLDVSRLDLNLDEKTYTTPISQKPAIGGDAVISQGKFDTLEKPKSTLDKILESGGFKKTKVEEDSDRLNAYATHKYINDEYYLDIAKKSGFYDYVAEKSPKMTAPKELERKASLLVRRNIGYLSEFFQVPAEIVTREEVDANVNKIKDTFGIERGKTKSEELGQVAMLGGSLLAAPAILEAPITALLGFGGFYALDQGVKAAVSKFTGKKIENISDALPDSAGETARAFVDIATFIAEGIALHGALKLGSSAMEKYAKDIFTVYKLPETVYLDGAKIKRAFVLGKEQNLGFTPAEEKAFQAWLESLPQGSAATAGNKSRLQALRDGVTIELPAEKIVTVVDKPWFAKIKQYIRVVSTEADRKMLGLEASEPSVTRTTVDEFGNPVELKPRVAPRGLLTEGKPGEVIPPASPVTEPATPRPLERTVEAAPIAARPEPVATAIEEPTVPKSMVDPTTKKPGSLLSEIISYKMEAAGEDGRAELAERIQKAVKENPEEAARISSISRAELQKYIGKEIFRAGSKDGMSWTFDESVARDFAGGDQTKIHTQLLTQELIDRAIFYEGVPKGKLGFNWNKYKDIAPYMFEEEILLSREKLPAQEPAPKLKKGEVSEMIQKSTEEIRKAFAAKENLQQHLDELRQELEISEPGERTFATNADGSTTPLRSPSTFPGWLPEDLRSTKLFEKVYAGLKDANSIQFPAGNRPKQRALYNELLKMLDKRLGVNTSAARRDILTEYGDIAAGKEEIANPNDRSVEGRKSDTRVGGKDAPDEIPVYTDEQALTDSELEQFFGGSASGAKAFIGKLGEMPVRPAGYDGRSLLPVEFPELVQLAKELLANDVALANFRKLGKRGEFNPNQLGGVIKLSRQLFEADNAKDLAPVLGHEIGHVIDWFPDKDLARGNILGRILTLHKFLKSTFGQENTLFGEAPLDLKRLKNDAFKYVLKSHGVKFADFIKNPKIRESLKNEINSEYQKSIDATGALREKVIKQELFDLSKEWRPFEEDKVPPDYLEYRKSSEELYADAISALLTNPGYLQDKAPIFFEAFFKYLDRKPEIKAEYFELQDLLTNPQKVDEARLNRIYDSYKTAREKRLNVEKAGEEKLTERKKGWLQNILQQHVSRFAPIYKKLEDLDLLGIQISDKERIRNLLEGTQMTRNDIHLFLDKVDQDIVQALRGIGVSEDEFGAVLELERDISQRLDIANPHGFQTEFAKRLKDFLLSKYSPEQVSAITEIVQQFHEYIFEQAEGAVKDGIYNQETFKTKIEPFKDSYATFQVVEYIDKNYVTAGIKEATGTLKGVENPLVSTVLKTVSLIQLRAQQQAKNAFIKLWHDMFPAEIAESEKLIGKGGDFIRFKDTEGKGRIELYVDGKMTGYDVDPMLAKAFERYQPTDMHTLVKISSKFNAVFKPLVTTYNVSWGFYSNIVRDTQRTFKNLKSVLGTLGGGKNVSVAEYIGTWLKSLPESVRFNRNQLTDLTRAMLEDKAFGVSFAEFNAKEAAADEAALKPIYRKYRFLDSSTPAANAPETAKDALSALDIGKKVLDGVKMTGKSILNGIKFAGSIFESNTKITGYQILKKRTLAADRAGFITRNYLGTPNYAEGGLLKQTDNNVFVFSNVLLQGMRTDLELARNPNTRGGYWWYTFVLNVLPKLAMLAGATGLLGKAIKDNYDKQTEYDKTNYMTIPLGETADGKAIYFRVPQDEMGRFYSAMVWKIGTTLSGDLRKPEQIVNVGVGMLPGVSPVWDIAGVWLDYVQGRNPYDSFRGRPILDDTTFKAGGMAATKDILKWTVSQAGIFTFPSYDSSRQTTFETALNFTPIVNRMIRVSDYGLTEKYKEVSGSQAQKEAKVALERRDLVDKYAQDWRREEDQSTAKLGEYLHNIVVDQFGGKPKTQEELDAAKRLQQQFKLAIQKGSSDTRVNALVTATSRDQQVALLKQFKTEMNTSEFEDFIKSAVREKVISAATYQKYKVLETRGQ